MLEMPCYRLARAGWASLGEMNTVISRPQVLNACEALDACEELEDDGKPKEPIPTKGRGRRR